MTRPPRNAPKRLSCNEILDLGWSKSPILEGTWQVGGTAWSSGLSVSGDGTGVAPHAGSVAVRMLADQVGLTWHLPTALARRGFIPGHDRGRVLVDVATMVTARGEAIADIDTLRHQQGVLGPVASPPTAWRALDELTPAALKRIAKARAKTRSRCGT